MHMDTGINTEDRAKVVESLSTVLADAYVLYLKTHNFHWNVTGPMFSSLHVMFEEQYTEQWNALDEIAERIRALGHFAPATSGRYAELSNIKEEPNVLSAKDMIRQLVDGNEIITRTLREGVKVADELDDFPTADLLTTRMEIHEKNAWMLRSFLEQGAGSTQGDASSD